MAPLVARLAMKKPLISRLSKSDNDYAHYLQGTEKVKIALFQCPSHKAGDTISLLLHVKSETENPTV